MARGGRVEVLVEERVEREEEAEVEEGGRVAVERAERVVRTGEVSSGPSLGTWTNSEEDETP